MATMTERIHECLRKTLPAKTCLTKHGIYPTDSDDLIELEGMWSVELEKDVPRLLVELPLLFQKIGNGKQYWNTNSETGKSKVEEWRKYKNEGDVEVSEGSFILAMLLLGYEFKANNERKYPHLIFNASYRNLMKYKCECGLEYTKAIEIQHKKSHSHITLMATKQKTTPSPPPRSPPPSRPVPLPNLSSAIQIPPPPPSPPSAEVHPLKYFAWTQGC
jgi:hypothetical protein